MNAGPTALDEALTRIRELEQALAHARSAATMLEGSQEHRTAEENRLLRSIYAKDRREVLRDLDAATEDGRRWSAAATEATERVTELEAAIRAWSLAHASYKSAEPSDTDYPNRREQIIAAEERLVGLAATMAVRDEDPIAWQASLKFRQQKITQWLCALRDARSCSNDCDQIATVENDHGNRRCDGCASGDGWRDLPIAWLIRASKRQEMLHER